MTYYEFSALFNFVTSAILGGFVLARNRTSGTHRSFFIFTLAVALWSGAYYLWQIADTATGALFWSRVLMAGAIYIPVTYLHFVCRLLNIGNRRGFLLFSYGLFTVFLVLDLTGFYVNHVEPLLQFAFWPIAGPAFGPFLLAWYAYVIYTTWLLYARFRVSQGLRRLQLKYVLVGMLFAFAGGSTNFFLWYRVPIPPVFNILVSAYVATIAYAIVRYRLMDIRVVARRVLVYLLASLVVYGSFYIILAAAEAWFDGAASNRARLAGIFVALVFVPTFQWVMRWIEILANRYLFFALYSYQETINRVSRQLTHHTDLAEIRSLITHTIEQAMGVEQVAITLASDDAKLGIGGALYAHLAQTKQPVVLEELDWAGGEKPSVLGNVAHQMRWLAIAAALPLISSGELVGVILLGPKRIGDAYTREDLELLTVLANQAGIAMDNARLYQQVREFSRTLEKKVDEQTRDLRAQAEHLRKLLKMRSEFLDIASHQLKTPISVIVGTASLFKEGSVQKLPPEEQMKFINNIYIKAQKLNQIIRDILQASEFDTEQLTLVRQRVAPLDLPTLVGRVRDDYLNAARDKGLALELAVKQPPPSPILSDPEYLEQAIANLVDNAIKYTQAGKVELTIEEQAGHVLLHVRDTGIGIPVPDQPRIFGKFERAGNAVRMYTDGSGLGLFITRQIVLAHPGASIAFKSQEGAGTEFTVSFPAYQKQS